MRDQYRNLAVVVIGRRLFDQTNGWNGIPAAGEHVFVVTHEPPADWEYAGKAPFTFVNGVAAAISAAHDYAGDRLIDVAGGEVGAQALRLGLRVAKAAKLRAGVLLAHIMEPDPRCGPLAQRCQVRVVVVVRFPARSYARSCI
jgi:hypothetical protein